MPRSTSDTQLDEIQDAAKRHGQQSEPDMEVGDLLVVLRLCWNSMDPVRRASVVEHWAVQELLESWGP